MEVRKERSLYAIFLRYLAIFCILSILLIFSIILAFNISLSNNILKPANYVQNQVEELKKEADEGINFDESKIPYPSKYVLFNDENEISETNFNEEELKEVNEYLKYENFKSKYIYSQISFKDGLCIIRYDIKSHFTSPYWNNLILYPETLLIGVFLIVFIFIALIIARKFGKKLKKELYPLKISTEKVMNQDLDFEIISSDVKEFNEVLASISNMKTALKESLQAQWNIEREKKNQICALAHDIKTPITIIKGNAELLSESKLSEDDKEFTKYIINNADKIEKYVSILMDTFKSDLDEEILKEEISMREFIDEIKEELFMLCSLKNIKAFAEVNYNTKFFIGNKELLIRAIVNIISNAVDYSSINSEVRLIINEENDNLIFTVRDCGQGFSNVGLKNATNQFYMESSERKVGKHYGMGLYIADSIAKKHNGFVVLKNRKDKSGAEVSLIINI